MFKNLLSSCAFMLLAFCLNAGAQNVKAHKISVGTEVMPKCSAGNLVTSKIDLHEGEYWGGYWDGTMDSNLTSIGTQNVPQSYSAAICYPAGSAMTNGMTIHGLRFSFPCNEFIEDVKIWMSTTLPDNPEDADILMDKVQYFTDIIDTNDPFCEERFSKPYECDPSKPLYIGYSFRVAGGNYDTEKWPVLVYMDGDQENALLMKYDAEGGEWFDYNGTGLGKLAVQVLMGGSYPEDDATIHGDLGAFTTPINSEILVPLLIENAGTNGISSIDLNITMNGESSIQKLTPDAPITGIGSPYNTSVILHVPDKAESYDFSIKIDKVNGKGVKSNAVAEGRIYAVSEMVERIPLMEEFTGMWCGACPRGIVGMQKLRQDYGDKISIVSVHSQDVLSCEKDYSEILNTVPAFPGAHVDRFFLGVDPYLGYGMPYGIKSVIEISKEKLPAAEIKAEASINGDILTAQSQTNFLFSGNASDFGIAYVLTEDGLHNDEWIQANDYNGVFGEEMAAEEPLFEFWMNNGQSVADVVYDDVAIAAKGITGGVEGSVPAEVTEGTENIHSVEFDLSKYSVIQNKDNLKVVVMLIDKINGTVVNSNFVSLNSDTGIEGVEDDSDVRISERYSVDGRRISVPEKGINIVKYTDGTVKKIIVK